MTYTTPTTPTTPAFKVNADGTIKPLNDAAHDWINANVDGPTYFGGALIADHDIIGSLVDDYAKGNVLASAA